MRFATWAVLLLLLIIPLLHRLWLRRNRPPKIRFSLPIDKSVRSPDLSKILLGIRYIAIALIVVALARPQSSYQETFRSVSGVDIMMVLDISASMNAEDLADASRLDVAKGTIKRFVQARGSDRIGLIVFSGEPLTLSPPTLDHGLVFQQLRHAKTGQLRDGTAIGDGLSLAVTRMRESKAKSRVIILLTDGDNNVGQVDPGTAGELAAGFGIRVYTIAIGKEGRIRIPFPRRTLLGGTVTRYQWQDNALNPELLEQIAKVTQGKFFRVSDARALEKVFKEIDRLEKTEVKTTEKVRYDEIFQTALKFAIFFLLLEVLIQFLWWRPVL